MASRSLGSRGPGFAYLGGVRVVGATVWCDVARARGVSFLSRADVAFGRAVPERLVASDRTITLRRALGHACNDPLVPRFGRPFALGRARLELIPSGALPGAAQLLVELGGWRGLYAGAVFPRTIGGIEPMQVRDCDELVIDAPEHGGVVDGMDALGADSLQPEDLRAVFALMLAVDAARLAPRARLARAAGLRATRRAIVGRRVISGQRAPGDDCLALGLGPTVEELVRFAIDSGAQRVYVRLHAREPLRAAGARALVAALGKRRIAVTPLGPPEQLSLFPR